jgi:hypothetical protein
MMDTTTIAPCHPAFNPDWLQDEDAVEMTMPGTMWPTLMDHASGDIEI